MITQADDEGRLVADPEQLRVQIFGYHPKVLRKTLEDSMSVLADLGLIRVYRNGDTVYADFPSWGDHQSISHPSPSKLPAYNGLQKLPEDSGTFQREGKGKEGKGVEGKGEEGKTKPPAAAETSGSHFEAFWSHYPRKVRKADARKIWSKLNPPLETVLRGLAAAKASRQWRDDGGKFIPYPERWLAHRQWEDEVPDEREPGLPGVEAALNVAADLRREAGEGKHR